MLEDGIRGCDIETAVGERAGRDLQIANGRKRCLEAQPRTKPQAVIFFGSS
jgi:hypothetical protein